MRNQEIQGCPVNVIFISSADREAGKERLDDQLLLVGVEEVEIGFFACFKFTNLHEVNLHKVVSSLELGSVVEFARLVFLLYNYLAFTDN